MAFDITKALGDISRSPVTSSAVKGRRELREIPLHLIDTNPRNFYSVDGIEELADNIRTVGLLEPLIVRKDVSGRYMLISGHRRRLALRSIAEAADNYPESMHEPIPCLVELDDAPLPGVEAGGDSELRARQMAEELRLIFANSDTRVMSSADTAYQVRRIRELFTGLQDLGYIFPGKMRDHVAAAAKVSSTRVARLDVIEKRLTEPTLRQAWQDGTLGETAAYEIARRPADVQKLALQRVGVGPLRGMTTEQVSTVLDACEADGNRDREARDDWNNNIAAMADAAKSATNMYIDQLHEEDTILRELCRKNLHSILSELMFFKDEYSFGENFRQANIDRMRKNDPHSSYTIGWNANDGTHDGISWSSKGIEVSCGRRPKFRRTWTEFYDALCGAAIDNAWKSAETVSAADTVDPVKCVHRDKTGLCHFMSINGGLLECDEDGTGSCIEYRTKDAPTAGALKWGTGVPPEPGDYAVRVGFGLQEDPRGSYTTVIAWTGSYWSERNNVPLRDGLKVFRWVKLPEV